jgi:sarcosine oxidase subunit alpha
MVAGVYDHGYVLAYERVSDHAPQDGVPRHRLWRIRTGQVISAIGAIERPLSFAGNDKPGVMLASAMRDYVTDYGVSPGRPDGGRHQQRRRLPHRHRAETAGLDVPCIVDARPKADGPLPQEARAMGIPVKTGTAIAGVKGIRGVVAVQLCNQAGEGAVTEEVVCEAVAMSGGWSPAVHLWSHCGGKLTWDEAGLLPPRSRAPPTNQMARASSSARGPRTARCMPPKCWRTRQRGAQGAGEARENRQRQGPQADAPTRRRWPPSGSCRRARARRNAPRCGSISRTT